MSFVLTYIVDIYSHIHNTNWNIYGFIIPYRNVIYFFWTLQGLQRLLNSRQLGLKLIANVTFGYTAANFSGRMPCVEVKQSLICCLWLLIDCGCWYRQHRLKIIYILWAVITAQYQWSQISLQLTEIFWRSVSPIDNANPAPRRNFGCSQ